MCCLPQVSMNSADGKLEASFRWAGNCLSSFGCLSTSARHLDFIRTQNTHSHGQTRAQQRENERAVLAGAVRQSTRDWTNQKPEADKEPLPYLAQRLSGFRVASVGTKKSAENDIFRLLMLLECIYSARGRQLIAQRHLSCFHRLYTTLKRVFVKWVHHGKLRLVYCCRPVVGHSSPSVSLWGSILRSAWVSWNIYIERNQIKNNN